MQFTCDPDQEGDEVPQYEHIYQNDFSYRKHKKQKEEDISICECKFDFGDPDSACGERCLNVITNTECTPGYCPCGVYCKNQVNTVFECAFALFQLQEEMKKQLNGEVNYTEEELEEYLQSHKRVMVDSLWKLNVADIEATLTRVCQLVLQDSEAKREELRARARGLKTLGKIFQRAKTASESEPLARTETQKLNEDERDYDDDASTSPKSNEASHSTYGTQEQKSPYVEEPKLGDEQFNYYFPRPAPPPETVDPGLLDQSFMNWSIR
ncbi:hypothetical protein F2Q70_00045558 [Brassica cretica]|uniref:AWS domain-containing protein n=1 Tax=Brassica cretica TaxID=69181 RepID=A0A8S9KHA9_BRACR|nr:hypothetical protein F2Q70_00045558 [Brassica cretica]